ncbi:uncharacterized protein AB9X84_021236 isoform 2-T2 [Acanthopagrus schlegelii]
MTTMKDLTRVLLLTCLLPTGLSVKKQSVFVYSRLGGVTLLPCTGLPSNPDCSLISWTFFKGGHVRYTEESTISDLQPGGNLTLNCILFTYYDVGSCRSYSSMFNLSWAAADGTLLQPEDNRYELIGRSRCSITLVTHLRRGDNNRVWRCQVTTKGNIRAAFQDFTSRFLFEDAPTALVPSADVSCPVHLPISRITLCVALPIMVIIVGVCTKRGDRRRAKTSAAGIELQEVHC